MGRGSQLVIFGIILLLSNAYGEHYKDFITSSKGEPNGPPNIVFILTDDQDITMNGLHPMAKTRSLIGDHGATFNNMFVASPLCCPSRSSILTGKYVHNHRAMNNSVSGGCSSRQWQKSAEQKAFPVYLKQLGYNTFFAGKYLNQYGHKSVGGVQHVPPGWDEWHGLVGNSRYYNYTLSVNGHKEKHGDNYEDDYLTDIISKKVAAYLRSQSTNSQPFFMMLSTPASHAPFTPAPQYSGQFSNYTAPRSPSFNYYGKDKHWLLRAVKHPMTDNSLQYIDTSFRNRWRTLLSVDDMVENVVSILTEENLMNNTYIVFTSDNGFHLGQFSLPNDKRQMYDFDTRVPFMIRGPGIPANIVRQEAIINIDLAPTFIELAGGVAPSIMDGRSLKPLLHTCADLNAHSWRQGLLIEHKGEFKEINHGCPQYNSMDVSNCFPDCVCEDAANNTYSCLRLLDAKTNFVFCKFADRENFTEAYDMHSDPEQLINLAPALPSSLQSNLEAKLAQLMKCSGETCRKAPIVSHRLRQHLYNIIYHGSLKAIFKDIFMK